MSNPSKSKLLIMPGTVVGRLLVGDLVRNVRDHPLYIETPQSYLQQGRLREVTCECGKKRLIAESILATGRIQSCGCLREEIRHKKAKKAVEKIKLSNAKKEYTLRIRAAQAELKLLQTAPATVRDEKAIEACAGRLRELFRQKNALGRKKTR